jgi:hypothetical protein
VLKRMRISEESTMSRLGTMGVVLGSSDPLDPPDRPKTQIDGSLGSWRI